MDKGSRIVLLVNEYVDSCTSTVPRLRYGSMRHFTAGDVRPSGDGAQCSARANTSSAVCDVS